jgi:hypothetical protein
MVANYKTDLSEHNGYLIHCFDSKLGGGETVKLHMLTILGSLCTQQKLDTAAILF